MVFDPSRYEDRMAEARRRFEMVARFEEPDRIPIRISTSGSYFCRLFGYNIRDYYSDPEIQIGIQMKALEWTFDELGDDRTGYGLHLEFGPIGEAIIFDMEVVRPDDTSPWIVHKIQTLEDIDRLEVVDPQDNPRVHEAERQIADFQERVKRRGINLPAGGGIGIHPPLSCACALAEPALIYEWMIAAPEQVTKLFDKCLDAFCRLLDYQDRKAGRRRKSIGLADDHSAFISNAMYRRMIFRYNKAIYDRYGRKGRHLHADGPNDHHFEMYANDMKLTQMDIGGFSDIAKAKPALQGKTVMSGGLNCKDLYGSFEEAKPAVERAVRIGGPGGGYIFAIGGETYVGVRPDTLIRTVEYVKQIGRYPLSP
jgi:uroporphyrinogen-III decarboxylase